MTCNYVKTTFNIGNKIKKKNFSVKGFQRRKCKNQLLCYWVIGLLSYRVIELSSYWVIELLSYWVVCCLLKELLAYIFGMARYIRKTCFLKNEIVTFGGVIVSGQVKLMLKWRNWYWVKWNRIWGRWNSFFFDKIAAFANEIHSFGLAIRSFGCETRSFQSVIVSFGSEIRSI